MNITNYVEQGLCEGCRTHFENLPLLSSWHLVHCRQATNDNTLVVSCFPYCKHQGQSQCVFYIATSLFENIYLQQRIISFMRRAVRLLSVADCPRKENTASRGNWLVCMGFSSGETMEITALQDQVWCLSVVRELARRSLVPIRFNKKQTPETLKQKANPKTSDPRSPVVWYRLPTR